jgi:hypothetical protein
MEFPHVAAKMRSISIQGSVPIRKKRFCSFYEGNAVSLHLLNFLHSRVYGALTNKKLQKTRSEISVGTDHNDFVLSYIV